MLDNWDYILVADHDFLDLLGADHMFFAYLGALLDMFEKWDISFFIAASRACKHDQLKDLLNATMHLPRLRSIFATLDRARPAALHFDTILTEKCVARGTLERHWTHDKFAKTTDKKVCSGRHPRRFVDLVGAWFAHFYIV